MRKERINDIVKSLDAIEKKLRKELTINEHTIDSIYAIVSSVPQGYYLENYEIDAYIMPLKREIIFSLFHLDKDTEERVILLCKVKMLNKELKKYQEYENYLVLYKDLYSVGDFPEDVELEESLLYLLTEERTVNVIICSKNRWKDGEHWSFQRITTSLRGCISGIVDSEWDIATYREEVK